MDVVELKYTVLEILKKSLDGQDGDDREKGW